MRLEHHLVGGIRALYKSIYYYYYYVHVVIVAALCTNISLIVMNPEKNL